MGRSDIAGPEIGTFAIRGCSIFEQLDFVPRRFHNRDQDLCTGNAGDFRSQLTRLVRAMRKFKTENVLPEFERTLEIRNRDPGVIGGDNTTARMDLDNEPQPDALLLIEPTRGGQARVSADDYVEAAPEWVGEISASSASFDLHTKLHVYRRNGVREYVVWRVLDQQLDWFVLEAGQFKPLGTDDAGILRSRILPGLWLDAAALLRGDGLQMLAALQQGLASPEHAAFVLKLQAPPAQR